jgi:hypothetical protein
VLVVIGLRIGIILGPETLTGPSELVHGELNHLVLHARRIADTRQASLR